MLGDDGIESVKSWGRDAKAAGRQIRQVAKEVTEDCDNDVLRNARSFYGGILRKKGTEIRKGERRVRKTVQQQRVTLREQKRLLEEERRRDTETKRKALKRLFIILICALAALLLLISAAFSFAERISGKSGEKLPSPAVSQAAVQPAASPPPADVNS